MYLWICFIATIISIPAYAAITGSWRQANPDFSLTNSPDTFTIIGDDESGYDIMYSSQTHGDRTEAMYYDASQQAYVDTAGNKLFYDNSGETMFYPSNSGMDNEGLSFIQDVSSPSVGLVFSVVMGNWTTPQPLNDSAYCPCVPDIITNTALNIFGSGMISYTEFSVAFIYPNTSSPNCAGSFLMDPPQNPSLLWTAYPDESNDVPYKCTVDFSSNASLTQMIVSFNTTNNTCYYSYKKDQGNVSGIWYLDWQTPSNGTFPTSYELTTVNNTYTSVNYTYANGTTINNYSIHFIGQLNSNLYFDYSLQNLFEYDSSDNVFITNQWGGPYSFYTPNGSFLDPSPFLTNWSIANTETDCCYPQWLQITQNETDNSSFVGNYFFSSEILNAADTCYGSINSSQVQSTFRVVSPSLGYSQLLLGDELGYDISFQPIGNKSYLHVNYQSCSFDMEIYSPGPAPGPKGSNWILNKVTSLLFIILMILFNL